jgi:uncharacterized protein
MCVVFVGCTPPSDGGPPRGPVVADLVRLVAIPRHEAFGTSAAALPAALDLCAAPTDASIMAAQQAWRQAAQDWAAIEAFDFGPAMDDHQDAAIWFWPTRPDDLEMVVMGNATIDAALVDGLGAASKGLPAIEAQLFDPDVLARFDPADPIGARRCALVQELAIDASEHAAALVGAWTGDYGDQLADPPNERYENDRAAESEIVNGIIALLQLVDDAKLAVPLGNKNNGQAQPELVESPYADTSLDAIATNLATVRALYVGADEGLGLQDLVRDPMLDESIVSGLDDADTYVAAVPQPLDDTVSNTANALKVADAITQVKNLRRLFSADLAQQLGVTVTISDNDGD